VVRGYQRLLGFEVSGGGFSLYGDSPHSTWLTAYGLYQLALLKDVLEVDPEVVDRAVGRLQETWRRRGGLGRGSLHERVFTAALCVRALARLNGGEVIRVYAEEWLDRNREVILANGYLTAITAWSLSANEPLRKFFLKAIERKVNRSGEDRCLPAGPNAGAPLVTTPDCRDVEATAFSALALLESGMNPSLANDMVVTLLGRRSVRFGWGTTWTTASVLSALLEMAGDSREKTVLDSLSIRVPSGVGLERKRVKLDSLCVERLKLKKEGEVRLSISSDSPGIPFLCRYSRYVPAASIRAKETASPFSLLMSWPKKEFERGEVVRVKFELETKRAVSFPILHVPLPPGAEFSQASFRGAWAANCLKRREVRRGEIVFYFSDLNRRGTASIVVTYRLTHNGSFHVRPAKVYEYYRPGKVALSKAYGLLVK
jgi:hypothetical protein